MPTPPPLTPDSLNARLAALVAAPPPPHPASGNTPDRHRFLFNLGREDLTLAKLAEAHFDALSILAEAGLPATPGALYAVWASDAPSAHLTFNPVTRTLSGVKPFCSGPHLATRALVTAPNPDPSQPGPLLLEADLTQPDRIAIDDSAWSTEAFRLTRTGAVTFTAVPATPVGPTGFYLTRPGFWHGALGPAACWAGGAAGLLDAALRSTRRDPHTLAHLAALHAAVWQLQAILDHAGREIDAAPTDTLAAHTRALTVRHLVETTATDILRRFARAYGPAPLAMQPASARRYAELDIFLRQSHAERDLEALAHTLLPSTVVP